jgi:hypothetical protein
MYYGDSREQGEMKMTNQTLKAVEDFCKRFNLSHGVQYAMVQMVEEVEERAYQSGQHNVEENF